MTDNSTILDHASDNESVDPAAALDPAPVDPAPVDPALVDPAPLAARAPVRTDSPLFSDFDIKPEIVQSLADVGITRTFAIQELTLPVALAGSDLIGQARTGTGKTLGFGVPLLNRLALPGGDAAAPQALVIAPTRELAVQVSGDLAAAGKRLGARVLTIYGGRAYEPQIEALRRGVDVAVGTPGRLLDLAQQGHLVLGNVRILVLDEADEMLDLGFLPDIEKLLKMVRAARQTMLFSATMPGPIVALARSFLTQPLQIRAESSVEHTNTDHVRQFAYRAHAMDKVELLARVLQSRERGLTMIFVRTKRSAAKTADDLESRGFAVAAVHGDLGQGAREQALRAFRAGKVDVLVATDVAARGLDVEGITHVINYQAPEDEMTYVHRIGRTARAGNEGTAVTLVDWDDLPRWKLICDKLSLPFHTPTETYSTSPHLYLELDIPTGAKGTLPRADRTRVGLDAEVLEDLGGRSPVTGRGTGEGRVDRHADKHGDKRGSGDRPRGGSSRGAGTRGESTRPDRTGGGDRPRRQRSRTRSGDGEAAPGTVSVSGPSTAATGTVTNAPASNGVEAPDSTTNAVTSKPTGTDASGQPRRRRRRRTPAAAGEQAGD